METYSPDKPIRVELDLEDDSGVTEVVVLFRRKVLDHPTIRLVGDGEGQKEFSLQLTQEVTDKVAPGEYYCDRIEVEDIHGNRGVVEAPEGLEFKIENVEGDYKEPRITGWRTL